MFYLFSAAAAIIPMFIYLMIIWKSDRYDSEPLGLIFINFMWGGLGAIILTFIFGILFKEILAGYFLNINYKFIEPVLLAPFIEEATKGIFLILVAANREFDNVTDGLVYGAAIGLGFGATENFLYFVTYGHTVNEWILLVIMRTLFSGFMHCVSTAALGAFIGLAKFKQSRDRFFLIATGFILAVLIHLIWNLSISFEASFLYGLAGMILIFFLFIAVFIFSIKNEKNIIYTELLDEAISGVIPAEHVTILNSARRKAKGWIDEDKRKSYVKAAITLAFRKMQYRNSPGNNKDLYYKDIEDCRLQIRELLLK